MLWSGAAGIVIDQVLTKTYVFYLIMNDKVIIINSKAFLPKADAMLDALLDYITP